MHADINKNQSFNGDWKQQGQLDLFYVFDGYCNFDCNGRKCDPTVSKC